MGECQERRERRIGNTGERLDAPVGYCLSRAKGCDGFARPARRFYRIEQIWLRCGHAAAVHRL